MRRIAVPFVLLVVIGGCGARAEMRLSPSPPTTSYAGPGPDLSDPTLRQRFACGVEPGWYASAADARADSRKACR